MEVHHTLSGKNVAVLIADGVEESEYTHPQAYFEGRGATFTAVAHKALGEGIQSYVRFALGRIIPVAASLTEANAAHYDALLIPGGLMSVTHLRLDTSATDFVGAFHAAGKAVCATTQGPGLFIEAGLVAGNRMTSCVSIADALRDAGADWIAEDMVVDGSLVTGCNRGQAGAEEALNSQIIGHGNTPRFPRGFPARPAMHEEGRRSASGT